MVVDPSKANYCRRIDGSFYIDSKTLVSNPFAPTALRRRHAQRVRYSSFSYKIDYFMLIKTFLKPEGHQHSISGSKVIAILLKGLILPIGGIASGRVCAFSLRSRPCPKAPLVMKRLLPPIFLFHLV